MALAERLEKHRDRIVRAGGGDGRTTIIAVTKGFGPDAVEAAVSAGLHDVGENYAQETRDKHESVEGKANWHFIGQLQRNKVRLIAPIIDLWQSVDTQSLADEIAKRSPGASVLIQVNLSPDPNRGGCSFDECPSIVEHARDQGLDVLGLMGVGLSGDPEDSRLLFRRLAETARTLELNELSMGMSGDYEVAVQEGSTMVRLGTALFGERQKR